jgi:drug/metabolite transporter (DMT)-like permease
MFERAAMPARLDAAGIAAGLAAGALWGLVFVAPRMLPQVGAAELTAGRFIAYGAIAALIMVATRAAWPRGAHWRAAWVLSVLGFTGYYLLLALSIQMSGTEVPTLIIGTIPIAVMLLGRPAHLRWAQLAPGLLLTVAGLAVMMAAGHGGPSGSADAPMNTRFWIGVALASASMACWTAFAVLNARYLAAHPEVKTTDWANWLGIATGATSVLAALLFAAYQAFVLPDFKPNTDQVGVFSTSFAIICIATGLGSSWLATVLWNIASRRLSASLCGQLIVSETLFALVYSFAWDGAWPNLWQWLAAALFTLGILASIRAHR